jgi:hypothetical protein
MMSPDQQRDGVSVQVSLCRSVLDAVFETEDHASTRNWSEPNMQDYRTGRHCIFKFHAHLVFVTKYRRDVLSELAIRDLAAIFSKVCRDFRRSLSNAAERTITCIYCSSILHGSVSAAWSTAFRAYPRGDFGSNGQK